MKLFNYYENETIRLGLSIDGALYSAESELPALSMDAVISGAVPLQALKPGAPLGSDIRLAPVVASPSKIVCAGLNYRDHAEETGGEAPEFPVLFSKLNDCLAAHNEGIPVPKSASKLDYEAELVVVIGKTAHNITEAEAAGCIFGYTCGNDVSARDAQFVSNQWFIGKNLPGFAPVGPWIVPAGEADMSDAGITCSVNGRVVQSSRTSAMIFSCAEIVAYASKYVILKPGDLIFTGTPSGVILGKPKGERVWLKAGDEMTVTIDGIGSLTNAFI